MVRKVCENLERKRELLYSFATIVFTPILYYFAVSSAFNNSPVGLGSPPGGLPGKEGDGGGADAMLGDTTEEGEKGQGGVGGAGTEGPFGNLSTVEGDIIDYISKRRELPFEAVLYIVLLELVKLFIVFTVYPGVHLFDQSPSLLSLWKVPGGGGAAGLAGSAGAASAGNGGRSSQGRLPFSKRDRDSVFVKSPPFHKKILEFWKGICNYVCSCAVCHLFVVLLGAPIVNDFKVTLQFGVILTTWIFGPMCLAVQPSRLLQELVFISAWNSDNEILFRTKWRFATTVFGAWVGAVVMPLDWDRPWQVWPVPCLVSTTFAFHITHLVLTFHLFFTIFEVYHRICSTSSESNKIKNF